MTVTLERRPGGVALIELSGGRLSALEAGRLNAFLGELAAEPALRAVVLAGSGPDFCAGAGDDLLSVEIAPPAALAALTCPVVAALGGEVASVGLELALSADLRVAARDTRLSLGDVVDGGRLPSWGGTQRLPRVAGRSAATRMILLGEVLDAESALATGLVDEVADDPRARADELVAELLRRAPLALAYAKEAVLRGAELPMRSAILLEADLNLLLRASRDRAEGLGAFFAKRPPDFTGE